MEAAQYPGAPLGGADNRLRNWIIIVAATLLLHALVLLVRFQWAGTPKLPPRVEIQEVDPKKLDAIRKQWSKQAKQLLINPDKSRPSDKEAPKDARYFSDRNIHVDKEQRARERDTNVVPKPGTPHADDNPAQRSQTAPPPAQTAPQTAPKEHADRPKHVPKLGDLGLPLKLGEKRPIQPKPANPDAPANRAQPQTGGARGGQQYVDDKLPEGSENILNAEESIYYSFYSRLYEAIGPIWQSRVNEVPYRRDRILPGEYNTVVDVVFDKDGNLLGIRRMRSSGIAEFDEAVDSAWKKIGRFPNPPDDLLNERGEVHTGWTFSVHVGSGGPGLQFLPPERNY